MSKKQKSGAKHDGRNLNAAARAGRVQAKYAVGIAAIVNAPCTGLLIGVMVGGCTEDES